MGKPFSKLFSSLGLIIFITHTIGSIIAFFVYSYQYIRDYGFISWLFFGEILILLKASIWELFLVLALIQNPMQYSVDKTNNYENSQEIPSYTFFVDMIQQQINDEELINFKKVFGQVDTIKLAAQIIGGQGDITESELAKHLRSHIQQAIPDLVIIEGSYNTDAVLLLQLDLTENPDNSFYGFLNLDFSRNVNVTKTDHKMSAQVWNDIITLFEKEDPREQIRKIIELQANKFIAVWIISNK